MKIVIVMIEMINPFTAGLGLNVQVEVFWIVTPCNVAVGYQWFGGCSG
jgi:hypothetical protein